MWRLLLSVVTLTLFVYAYGVPEKSTKTQEENNQEFKPKDLSEGEAPFLAFSQGDFQNSGESNDFSGLIDHNREYSKEHRGKHTEPYKHNSIGSRKDETSIRNENKHDNRRIKRDGKSNRRHRGGNGCGVTTGGRGRRSGTKGSRNWRKYRKHQRQNGGHFKLDSLKDKFMNHGIDLGMYLDKILKKM